MTTPYFYLTVTLRRVIYDKFSPSPDANLPFKSKSTFLLSFPCENSKAAGCLRELGLILKLQSWLAGGGGNSEKFLGGNSGNFSVTVVLGL